ncbi:MAG: ribonuclease E/G [Lachnospiraceae bacterium]|nr:ribonuclease E/G [Lachnospiraceae bacterium]
MIKPSLKDCDGKLYINTSGLELVITKKDNKILSLLFDNKRLIDMEADISNALPLDTVCVGKIAEISKNINAAFVLLPDKSKGYLKNIKEEYKCEMNLPVRITRLASKGKLCSVTVEDRDISHAKDLTVLEYGLKGYIKILNNYDVDRIITDCDQIYDEIINENLSKDIEVKLYFDKSISLWALFSISKYLKEATEKTVWLKSGANICIETTSAFTVIDVNSGKYISKNNCYLDVNIEASNEIFRQMTLRNISGIILVDFINLQTEEERNSLINHLKNMSSVQKIHTRFVDITPLGIAEFTRKKIGLTLYDLF